MKVLEVIKAKLGADGWNLDELIYEQLIHSQGSERGYRAAVVLVYRGYFLGIVDVPPIKIPLADYAQQLYSDVALLEIPTTFVFYDDAFYRLETGGELALHKPVELTPDRAIACRVSEGDVAVASDPRFAMPSVDGKRPLRIKQLLAVSRTLDALAGGQKVALIELPVGSGKTLVQVIVVSKLIRAGVVNRVLVLATHATVVSLLVHAYRQFGLEAENPSKGHQASGQIVVMTDKKLLAMQKEGGVGAQEAFDLVVVDEPNAWRASDGYQAITAQKPRCLIGMSSTPVSFAPFAGKTTYRYTFKEAVDELPTPAGFDEHELGSFATAQQGLPVLRSSDIDGNVAVGAISARNIGENGELSFDSFGTVDSVQYETFGVSQGDILVSVAGATRKIAYVDTMPKVRAIFTSSLIRIRTAELGISPTLFKFLSSSLGTSLLDKLSYGTVQKHLSPAALRKMLVYFAPGEFVADVIKPVVTVGHKPESKPEFTRELSVVEVLKAEIIPALEELSKPSQAGNDGVSNKDIAARLGQLATYLAGRTIEEHVLESFPSPIALAYRRYRDARFNVFEQVLRLRDLAEACTFFVYNVFLADYLRNLVSLGYAIQDKGARKAYSGFSMAARIDFIAELLAHAAKHDRATLFLAEFTRFSAFPSIARVLNEDLRNSLSHTAAASESQQSAILQRFVPVVMSYLEGLEFLTSYRLARIPAYYAKDGKFFRRVEVYTGVSPYIDEEEITTVDVDSTVSRDHLVLVSPEGVMLNMHPLYQLISNAETRHETHLCLLKQRKNGVLQGESVQGSFSVGLNDADYFEKMIPSSEG